jgi:hypothetical protein
MQVMAIVIVPTALLSLLFTYVLFMLQASVMVVQAEKLEPWVSHTAGIFSKEDCQRLIQAAEQISFPEDIDSIEYNDENGSFSWAIDVEESGKVAEPILREIYQQYLPIVSQIVSQQRIQFLGVDVDEHSPPSLDWVFLRKYQAGSIRQMLSLHNDVNLITVIIALNDDYEGGGLFYVKPDTEWEFDADGVPELPDDLDTHEFLSSTKRQNNTSNGVVFPDLHTGDILIHNYTLFHAIAPLERGTRYSLIFFYDQQHPRVAHLNDHDVNVTLMNYWFDEPVSLYWISSETVKLTPILILETIPKKISFTAESEQVFAVESKQTGKFLMDFEIPSEADFDGIIELIPDDDDYDEDYYDDDDYDDDEYKDENENDDSIQINSEEEDLVDYESSEDEEETTEGYLFDSVQESSSSSSSDDDELHPFVFRILDNGEEEQELFREGEKEDEEEYSDVDENEVPEGMEENFNEAGERREL